MITQRLTALLDGLTAVSFVFVERLANRRARFMCHPCDMDAPVLRDTGWESIDFAGIWQTGPVPGVLDHLGACKSPLTH
jgi:hypothetical protein